MKEFLKIAVPTICAYYYFGFVKGGFGSAGFLEIIGIGSLLLLFSFVLSRL